MQPPITHDITMSGRAVLNEELSSDQQRTFVGYINELNTALGNRAKVEKENILQVFAGMFSMLDHVVVASLGKGNRSIMQESDKNFSKDELEKNQVWYRWCGGATSFCSRYLLNARNETFRKRNVWQFFELIENGKKDCKSAEVSVTLFGLERNVHSFLAGMGVSTK